MFVNSASLDQCFSPGASLAVPEYQGQTSAHALRQCLESASEFWLRGVSEHVQPRRDLSFRKVMPAVAAICVGNPYSIEASHADWSCLKSASRAELIAGHDWRATVWARSDKWLPQQKIDDRSYSDWHDQYDQHPQSRRHPPALDIQAYISDQQYVASEDSPPGIPHQQPHRQQRVSIMRQHAVKEVLSGGKDDDRQCNRPVGNYLLMTFPVSGGSLHFIRSLIQRHGPRLISLAKCS